MHLFYFPKKKIDLADFLLLWQIGLFGHARQLPTITNGSTIFQLGMQSGGSRDGGLGIAAVPAAIDPEYIFSGIMCSTVGPLHRSKSWNLMCRLRW